MVLILSVALTLISLPLGFDQHHSGLILATLNEFEDAVASGKEYPFNQYGPGWILIFHIALILAPANYFFLAIKLVGLFFVFLSLIATYHLAGYFLDRFWSLVSIAFMLITYPFFTGFLPWPSLVVMPIVPYIASVFVRFTLSNTPEKQPSKIDFLCVGFLVGITLFTRAQIGIALVLAIFLIFLFQGYGKAMIPIISTTIGFALNLVIVFGFLHYKGWLRSSLYDEFVLGFMYVLGDKSTFPFPIGTSILVLVILATYSYIEFKVKFARIHQAVDKFLSPTLIGVALLMLTLVIVSSARLFNRFWIALVIAIFLIFFFTFVRGLKFRSNPFQNPLGVLLLFSAVALLQIWPLFDQMHTWWALTPVSVLVSLLLKEKFFNISLPRSISSAILISIFLLMSNHALTVYRTFSTSSEIPIRGLALNYTFESNVEEMKVINDFLSTNIPRSSSVLNLCSNGNAFFVPGFFNSASRNVIFWSTMKDNRDLIQDIKASRPTHIISCDFTPFSSQIYNYDMLQNELVESIFVQNEIRSVLSLSSSRKITILVNKQTTVGER